MKNVLLVTNAILCVAVIVLFYLVLGDKSHKPTDNELVTNSDSLCCATLPIAYVNVDSLLSNYQFYKDVTELLTRQEEDARLTFNTKARQLQEEMNDFQRKLENNVFLSRERAESEQVRLLQKQQELQELDTKLSQELFAKQQEVSRQLGDTITRFLEEFNKDQKYELIISNTANDNVLHAKSKYDITHAVADALNRRYVKK